MNTNKKKIVPTSLFRYRPLGDNIDNEIVIRELDAICGSYLYAPSFEQMNDPMEALFESLGEEDPMRKILPDNFISNGNNILNDAFRTARNSGLISMSETHLDYPLWAYYGSSFAGMCLEFDTQELLISMLPTDAVLPIPVTYNSIAPKPFSFELLTYTIDPIELIFERLCQKRKEWKHEKEWRYLAGKVGKKEYAETALKRIYLGPRIDDKVKLKIVEVMQNRPVEILEGKVKGYEIVFSKIKANTPWHECELISTEKFDPSNMLDSLDYELSIILGKNFQTLVDKCKALSTHPNLVSIEKVALTDDKKICVSVRYRLRGKKGFLSHKHFFNLKMEPIVIQNYKQLL